MMNGLFIPSLINLLVPLAVTSFLLGAKSVIPVPAGNETSGNVTSKFEQNQMFDLGLGILVAVPVFKTLAKIDMS